VQQLYATLCTSPRGLKENSRSHRFAFGLLKHDGLLNMSLLDAAATPNGTAPFFLHAAKPRMLNGSGSTMVVVSVTALTSMSTGAGLIVKGKPNVWYAQSFAAHEIWYECDKQAIVRRLRISWIDAGSRTREGKTADEILILYVTSGRVDFLFPPIGHLKVESLMAGRRRSFLSEALVQARLLASASARTTWVAPA
jgi:hypothetical protein